MNITTPLTSIIIDDEKMARDSLKVLLHNYCPEIKIIGEGENLASLKKLLHTHNPSLIFLDIQLRNTTIFDLISNTELSSVKIIFISAHDQYALKGYKYDAVDYLLKPVDPIKLKEAVIKVKSQIEKEQESEYKRTGMSPLRDSPQIVLSDTKGSHIIKTKDIMYCIAEGNYTAIVLHNQPQIVVSKNLKFFEEKLNSIDFYRIHKSNLINLNYLKLLSNDDGGHIVMSDGKTLSISRDKKRKLLKHI